MKLRAITNVLMSQTLFSNVIMLLLVMKTVWVLRPQQVKLWTWVRNSLIAQVLMLTAMMVNAYLKYFKFVLLLTNISCIVRNHTLDISRGSSPAGSIDTSDDEMADDLPVIFLNDSNLQSKTLIALRLLQHFAVYTSQKKNSLTYLLQLLKHHLPVFDYENLPETGESLLKIESKDFYRKHWVTTLR